MKAVPPAPGKVVRGSEETRGRIGREGEGRTHHAAGQAVFWGIVAGVGGLGGRRVWRVLVARGGHGGFS